MLLYTLLIVFSSQFSPDEIKKLRKALGLSQAKFANKLRVSRVIVAYWETGKYRPSPEHQHQLDQIAIQLAKPSQKSRQAPQVKRKSKKTILMEKLDLKRVFVPSAKEV